MPRLHPNSSRVFLCHELKKFQMLKIIRMPLFTCEIISMTSESDDIDDYNNANSRDYTKSNDGNDYCNSC